MASKKKGLSTESPQKVAQGKKPVKTSAKKWRLMHVHSGLRIVGDVNLREKKCTVCGWMLGGGNAAELEDKKTKEIVWAHTSCLTGKDFD